MYKLTQFNNVIRLSDNTYIPFEPANTDYAKFKTDIVGLSKDAGGNILEASELQDADGNVMTREQVLEFFHTLP